MLPRISLPLNMRGPSRDQWDHSIPAVGALPLFDHLPRASFCVRAGGGYLVQARAAAAPNTSGGRRCYSNQVCSPQAKRVISSPSTYRRRAMANVYIEPRPKGRPEGSAIDDYVVEDGADNVLKTFNTQKDAIDWAKKQGHHPLVARVRHLNNKKMPDQWRAA
jgi:hypothetical protein